MVFFLDIFLITKNPMKLLRKDFAMERIRV